jgi:D-cysteine desulfhydrase
VLTSINEAKATTDQLAVGTLALLRYERSRATDAIVMYRLQCDEAYGLPTNAVIEALRLLACSEGLLLDSAYSGISVAGFRDQVRSGGWQDLDVLFVMTGGTPWAFCLPRDADQAVTRVDQSRSFTPSPINVRS